jgi:hypothetical protein
MKKHELSEILIVTYFVVGTLAAYLYWNDTSMISAILYWVTIPVSFLPSVLLFFSDVAWLIIIPLQISFYLLVRRLSRSLLRK